MKKVVQYGSCVLFLIFCSCGTRQNQIDEKYASDLVKDKLLISGDVISKKLSGGHGNTTNFLVSDSQKKYVARFFKNASESEVEIYNFKVASHNGYGPHIYFADPSGSFLILEYLSSKKIAYQDLQNDQVYVFLANLLRKIHHGQEFIDSGFDVFKKINKQLKLTKPKYNNYIPLTKIENVINVLYQVLSPNLITNIPCHNDLHSGNLMFLGNEFKAIDYGDAGQGDPYFDLATVVLLPGIYYNAAREKILFTTYLGHEPLELEKAKLYLMKQVVLIKWAFDALDRLKVSPETIYKYNLIKAPLIIDFLKELFEEKVDTNKPEDNLKLLKVLFSEVLNNFESQEFKNAIKLLSKK